MVEISQIPDRITAQDIGKTFTITPVRRPDLELRAESKVFRFPFRSNGFYFTRDMWLDKNTLLFETLLNPQSTGTPIDPCYSMVMKGTFSEDRLDVQIVIPPEERTKLFLGHLNPEKNRFYYATEQGIFCLNLQNLERNPVFQFGDHAINHTCMSIALSCDESKFFYATWKRHKSASPNGQIIMVDLATAKEKVLDSFRFPEIKLHLDCNPTNKNELHYCKIHETDFPRTSETEDRLWMMNLNDFASRLLYKHKRTGLFRKPEIVTHEAWSSDGKYLTAVVRRNWIKKIHISDGSDEVIMDGRKGGQNPWHCDGRNGKMFVFDTMNKDTGLWLGEFGSSKLINLCRTQAGNLLQAHHPHPFLSPDLKYVFFNSLENSTGYLHYVQTDI